MYRKPSSLITIINLIIALLHQLMTGNVIIKITAASKPSLRNIVFPFSSKHTLLPKKLNRSTPYNKIRSKNKVPEPSAQHLFISWF